MSILELWNKLQAEEVTFPDEQSQLHYTLNCLEGNTLQQVIHSVNEETEYINIESLNAHLDTFSQANENSDRVCMATGELRQLYQQNLPFETYLTEFSKLMRNLAWDEDVQKT